MDPVANIIKCYQVLQHEWAQNPQNLDKCGELLDQLKVALTQLKFLPTSNSSASKKELIVARDILELGAQWSIKKENIPSFERYMAQLKCYYLDYKSSLPESVTKYQLLGLNLLCLLAQNRVAEFHTELELLPPTEIQSNIYIRHPVSMEQYLMEGSYNKVFQSGGNVPAESYSFFINILLDTVRNEIAACIEKAYEKVLCAEAGRMLFFPNNADMKKYGEKKGWKAQGEFYAFSPEKNKSHPEDHIPSFELATQAIEYARELEMIV